MPNRQNENAIEYRMVAPSAKVFAQFRADCGWGLISGSQAQAALDNSLYVICAFDGDKTVGFGRLIGDGALNFYVQDLIVDSNYRGASIGSTLLDKLLAELKANMGQGQCTVGLMAAVGKEAFYEKFGFIKRPNDRFGCGMSMDIQ